MQQSFCSAQSLTHFSCVRFFAYCRGGGLYRSVSFSRMDEAEMLDRPPEPERSGRLRDLVMVFGLVAVGILTTAGAVWAVFQVGGVVP